MPREKRCQEKRRVHFSCQAQYLVKLECDFSWQAQHFVILGDGRSAKRCIFFIQNASPRWDESGLRSGGCEMTISCSDYPRNLFESSFYWRKQPLKS